MLMTDGFVPHLRWTLGSSPRVTSGVVALA